MEKLNKIYAIMDGSDKIGAVIYSELTKLKVSDIAFEANQVVNDIDSCETFPDVFRKKMRKADKKFKWLNPKEIDSHQIWWS